MYWDCPSLCPSVCRQNAYTKTRLSQKLSSLYWRRIGSPTWAFQRTHYWTPKIQDGGDPPSWKSTWRHFSAVGGPIWMKFGRLVQNGMPTAVIWSKSKPEIEFQYGGRLFFQNGYSYISAVDWDIIVKFGLLIDIDLLKWRTSANPKPEVYLRLR